MRLLIKNGGIIYRNSKQYVCSLNSDVLHYIPNSALVVILL